MPGFLAGMQPLPSLILCCTAASDKDSCSFRQPFPGCKTSRYARLKTIG